MSPYSACAVYEQFNSFTILKKNKNKIERSNLELNIRCTDIQIESAQYVLASIWTYMLAKQELRQKS